MAEDEEIGRDEPLATSEMDEPDLPVDEEGNPVGMFAGPCEFCGQGILPLPTLEQQQLQVCCLCLWNCVVCGL